jgi:hypothetical protein
MADTEAAPAPDATFNEQVEHVLSLVGEDDAAPETTPSGGDVAADPAPDTVPASVDEPTTTEETDAVEPAEKPAIDAPETFTDELKARFKSLPEDLQQTLAQWETDRQRGVNAKLEEAANQRKAAETQQAAISQERQRLAEQLTQAINLAQTFNPILAEAAKMTPDDWATLAREDKARWVEFSAQVSAEQYKVQQAINTRNSLMSQRNGEIVASEHGALLKALPELADPVKAKAFASELDKTMRSYGFASEEVAQVVDHRMLRVARDAMLYRAGEAQRLAAAAKAKQVVPKVQRPGTGEVTTPRNDALRKRIAGMTSLSDQADAIASLIEG